VDTGDERGGFVFGPNVDGFEGREGPRLHGTIAGGGDNEAQCVVEEKFGDGAFVSETCFENWVDFRGRFRLKIPDADAAIVASTEDVFAVGGESDAQLFALGLIEGVETFAVGDAPELDGLVCACGGEDGAVGRERKVEDRAVVAFQGLGGFLGIGGEKARFAIVTGGGDPFPVWREDGGVEDVTVLAFEGADDVSRGGIDEQRFAGFSGLAGSGEEAGSVRTKLEVVDFPGG